MTFWFQDKIDNSQGFQKNQTSLFHMIRDSLLALYLLPNNASAGLKIICENLWQDKPIKNVWLSEEKG